MNIANSIIQIGHDPLDPLSAGNPRDAETFGRLAEGVDFREACQDDALMGMRIAVSVLVMRE